MSGCSAVGPLVVGQNVKKYDRMSNFSCKFCDILHNIYIKEYLKTTISNMTKCNKSKSPESSIYESKNFRNLRNFFKFQIAKNHLGECDANSMQMGRREENGLLTENVAIRLATSFWRN